MQLSPLSLDISAACVRCVLGAYISELLNALLQLEHQSWGLVVGIFWRPASYGRLGILCFCNRNDNIVSIVAEVRSEVFLPAP